ncbi:EAL domain-containing protein [Paraglaciecola sp. 20A4]|uniref:putative bifunctional diguanylate cyclase/phosphodiesterase n=1 Tax=Paraglaciecola sp. 20A4 TaxID=2687288 RepID=UPI00140D2A18|nr:EAL domain-containing protein [Paraglaciecola sp. 20A4]
MLQKDELKTAVWIFDIDKSCIVWANQSALDWWESPSLEELQSRNFEEGASQAVKDGLREYQNKFYNNESLIELWHFSPNGIDKKAYCWLSGIRLADNRMGMQVEATPSNIIPESFHANAIAIMATFDMQGCFQSCNPPFSSEFGNVRPSLSHLLCKPELLAVIKHSLSKKQKYETDLLLHALAGDTWFRASFSASKDTENNASMLCQLHNIDERKKREFLLLEQAHTDSLTGLLNRRGFSVIIQPKLTAEQNIVIFYIDLDGFKMINDSLGHQTGDLVLQQVATRLMALEFAALDCCRFGGDEFVVALPNINRALNIDEIAQSIVNTLSVPYEDDNGSLLAISASLGVARCPDDSDDLVELIRFADAAMYCSKKRGKKRSTIFIAGMEKEILRKSRVTQQLNKAIEKGELSLHYQTIIDPYDNSIYSFEALLRWFNPELGHVSPQELIDVAERTGLIHEIENWVINTAISSLGRLRQYTNSQARIAVNISSIHLVDKGLTPYLLSTLCKHRLSPRDLIIEITESVLLDDLDSTNNPVTAISSTGINISIDDFGTGYSSLAYLQKIKATSVKIDKAFVNDDGNLVETLSAINNVIVSLGMRSVVEGIETEQQANSAKKAGIALQQGYWYTKPKPLDAYKEPKHHK